jgi:hypothetical protein
VVAEEVRLRPTLPPGDGHNTVCGVTDCVLSLASKV